jgi:nucleoside-diphosphate-sugar epimerase
MHAEQELVRVVGSSPIRVTILRMATLYGEGDPGNVARLIRAIDKRRFVWIGVGGNRKSLLYRDDAAQACLTVARGESAAGVSTYNVPSIPYPLGQIVGSIEKALGVRVPRWHIPGALALAGAACLSQVPTRRTKALARTARKWLADDVFDGRRFEAAFCFRPTVSLDEGILRETRWIRGEEHWGESVDPHLE